MAAVLVWHGAPSRRYPRPETEPDPSPRAGPEAEPGPRMIQGPKKRARSVGPPDRAGPSDPPGLGRARVNLNARQTHPPAQDTPAGRGADLCPAGGEGGEAARVHSAQGRFPASAPSLPRPTPPETPAEFRLVITGAVAAPRPPRSAAMLVRQRWMGAPEQERARTGLGAPARAGRARAPYSRRVSLLFGLDGLEMPTRRASAHDARPLGMRPRGSRLCQCRRSLERRAADLKVDTIILVLI